MHTRLGVVLVLVVLAVALQESRPAGLEETNKVLQAPVDLSVEGLSVYTVAGETPARITISFRVVNRSFHVAHETFRTRVSPGIGTFLGLEDYFVSTVRLGAWETLYVSRTLILFSDPGVLPISVETDVDHALVDPLRGNNVATTSYVSGGGVGHWVSIGPTRITRPPEAGYGQYDAVGRICAVAIHPTDPNVIYIASPGQLGHEGSGVWKTESGGISWIPVTESFPGTSIAAIAIDPGGFLGLLEKVYVLTSDDGLFRSDDHGTSWIKIHGNLNVRRNTGIGDPTVLLMNPQQTSTMYVTTRDGVKRSKDGGKSWNLVLAGEAMSLVMDPINPQVLYAAVKPYGVYRNDSGGDKFKWKWVPPIIPFSSTFPPYGFLLALSHPASDPVETVYALIGAPTGSTGTRLYRTDNRGQDWSLKQTCVPPSDETSRCDFMILGADPSEPDRVYQGGPYFYISSSGGSNPIRIPGSGNDRQPDSAHGDYHGFAIDPTDPNVIYAGTDGGLYRSPSKGDVGTWSFISPGVTNAELYDLAQAGPGPLIISGTQDNGTIRYSGRPIWDHIYPGPPFGGDGGVVAIDWSHLDTFYSMFQFASSVVQSIDGGLNWDPFNVNLPAAPSCGNYNLTFDFQTHPVVPSTLLASCLGLWRTDADQPGTWRLVFLPPLKTKGRVVRSAVEPASDMYYAGTGQFDGRIYAGAGGFQMQQIFKHPTGMHVTDIEPDPVRGVRLYATFASPPVIDRNCSTGLENRVYQLRPKLNALPGFPYVALDISSDLPANLCVNTIAPDPLLEDTVYIGTNRGVYRGHNRAVGTGGRPNWRWASYNYGMPGADVRDLEFQAVTGRLFAATFGRGAFMLDTRGPSAPAPGAGTHRP